MQKPKKLKPGDRIATVSSSWGGPGAIPQRYDIGVKQFENAFGVEVVEMEHTRAVPEWVKAHPEHRAADLMRAFEDPTISGIVSTIGGDDSVRLLPFLDLDIIANNPKVYLGYSDTTVTHLACFKAGLTSYYGPSIMSGFAENGGLHSYLENAVRNVLFQPTPTLEVPKNSNGWTVEFLDWFVPENNQITRTLNPTEPWRFLQEEGVVSGPLLGGCLDVLKHLTDSTVWPSSDQWKDSILFVETSERGMTPTDVADVFRVFGHLGILENLSGVLFARPGGNIDPTTFTEYDRVLHGVIREEFRRSDIPIVTGLDFGHTDPMCVLPYGVQTEIDSESETIKFLEPTTR